MIMSPTKKTSTKSTKKAVSKKTTSKKPAKKDDELMLETAVGDLAKQTEALLGKSGEKIAKPVLPKKQSKPSTKHAGKKSFDIIHPNEATSSASVLKAPHPGQKLLEADDGQSEAVEPKVEKSSSASSAPTIVSTHNPGSLNVMSKKSVEPIKRGVAAVQAEQEDDSEDEQIVPVTRTVKAKAPAQNADSNSGDDTLPEQKDDTSKNDDEPAADKAIELDSSPVNDIDRTPDKADAPSTDPDEELNLDSIDGPDDSKPSDAVNEATKSIQLQSDNLNDGDESDEPKPVDIYDTDEYHPTLHDWSKLSKQNHTPLYILLLLTVVLGAVLYIVYADISIPFIPF